MWREIDRFMWNPIAYMSGNLSQSYWNRQLVKRKERQERDALNHPFISFPWY